MRERKMFALWWLLSSLLNGRLHETDVLSCLDWPFYTPAGIFQNTSTQANVRPVRKCGNVKDTFFDQKNKSIIKKWQVRFQSFNFLRLKKEGRSVSWPFALQGLKEKCHKGRKTYVHKFYPLQGSWEANISWCSHTLVEGCCFFLKALGFSSLSSVSLMHSAFCLMITLAWILYE